MNPTTSPPLPQGDLDEVLDHARRLHDLGFGLVPCCRPVNADGECSAMWHPRPCGKNGDRAGKRVLVEDYPRLAQCPLTWDRLERLLRRLWPVNLAVVMGAGLLAVETDSLDGEEELIALAGPVLATAPCRERRPGRGRASLLRVPDGMSVSSRTRLGASKRIDVLGESALLVIQPSVHRTGHRIAWVAGRAPWDCEPPPCPSPLLQLAAAGLRQRPAASREPRRAGLGSGTIPAGVRFLIESRREVRDLWMGHGKRRGDCSASGYDYALAFALLKAKVPPDEVAAALGKRPGAHRHDAEYAARTVEAALGHPFRSVSP